MRGTKLILMSLLLLAAGCASVGAGRSGERSIFVIRHLHTPKGATDPDLTSEGQRVAALLPAWFAGKAPGTIYVSKTKRALQTAAPTAARYGVTPKTYDPANTPALVAAVLAEPGSVMIVGHSNTVPDIVAALGGPRPKAMVHEDFGDLWEVRVPSGTTKQYRIGD